MLLPLLLVPLLAPPLVLVVLVMTMPLKYKGATETNSRHFHTQ